jgi:hypothetical protein
LTPTEGNAVYVNSEDNVYVYDGANWKQIYPAVWG